MGQRKIFVSRTGVELAIRMLPKTTEMFFEIKDDDTITFVYFDEKDTADLIRELQKIKKQIAK